MNTEVMPQSLDLFSKEPTLLSIEKFFHEKIPTKTQLDDPNLTQFEFSAPMSRENYTDLGNSFLYLRIKITKKDGTDIAGQPKVGVAQFPIGSLIKSCEIQLNNQRITPLEDNYNYIAFLSNVVKANSAKKGYLSCGLWVNDTLTSAATADQSSKQKYPLATTNQNTGLESRASWFSGSREVEMIGKIYAAPHNGSRLFPCFCAFDYKFSLAPQEFVLMTSENPVTAGYLLKITAAELHLKRVQVNPAVRIAHATLLQKKNFYYPLHYIASRPRSIPSGTTDFQWPGLFSGGDIPNSIAVIFVASNAKNGDLKRNPYFCQNVNMESLQLNLGSRTIPQYNFNTDVGTYRSLLNYWQTIMGLGYHWGSDNFAGNFNRTQFQTAMFISCFDLTRDENPNANYTNTTFVTEQINLNGKFRSATTENMICLAFGHFHSAMEIDSSYRPICSW